MFKMSVILNRSVLTKENVNDKESD